MTSPDAINSDVVPELVEELINRLQAGESAQAFIAKHPDHAATLCRLLPAVRMMAELSASGDTGGLILPEVNSNGQPLGDFQILREVGRGGMGVVYEAEQLSLSRRVALKVLPLAATMDPRHLQRFHNEARAAASLLHPHIVPVYGVGCERGVHYYAMQFIDGIGLDEVIAARRRPGSKEQVPRAERCGYRPGRQGRQCPPVSLPEAGTGTDTDKELLAHTPLSEEGAEYYRGVARLAIQAAEALDYAHGMGVVHRDIKPGNLLLDSRGQLWVADFGLAQVEAEGSLTASGDLLGTARYMSPEQAQGSHLLDQRSDIYSLGVTLYELLALQPAFQGTNRQQLIRQVIEDEPAWLRQMTPSIPHDLETVALKAMAKDPTQRYRTAQEMADDLRRFLNDEPVLARRAGLTQRASKWIRRNRTVVTVALLVAVTLIVGTAVSVWQAIRARDAEHLAHTRATQALEAAGRERLAREQATRSALRARRLLYAGDVLLAGQAWRNNDVSRMRELLAGHIPDPTEPDFRGFEWHFLWKQTGIPSQTLKQGDSPAYHVCFSPDGKTLATAGKDTIIRLFDGRTFKLVGSIPSGQGEVNGLAFTPDSRTLASAGDDGTLALWDLATRQQIRCISAHPDLAFQVAFSPDGKVLASCGRDPVVRLWDPTSGQSLGKLAGHDKNVEAIVLSPRGILAAASRDQRTSLWDLKTRAKICNIENGNRGAVFAVAFTPKGKRLAQGQDRGLLTLVDVGDEVVVTGRHVIPNGVQSLAFAPAGSSSAGLLAVGDRGGVIYLLPGDTWERETGLALATEDERLFQWQAHQGRVYSLTFTPDGRGLVSAGQDGRVMLWDLGKRDTEHRIRQDVDEFVFLDDHRLALEMPGAPVHDLRTGTLHRPPGQEPPCTGIARAAKAGRLFAVNPAQGVLGRPEAGGPWTQVWTPPTGFRAGELTVSADGRFLAVEEVGAPGESTLALFDLESRRSVARIFAGEGVKRAQFSPDGRHVAFTSRNDVCIVKAASGKILQTLQGHTSSVKDLAFSPDGRHLASVSKDRTLKVWDWRTGRERWSTLAHHNRAFAVAFSPDGHTIATAGLDNVLRFWRWEVERLAFELPTDLRSFERVAFSPDGRRLACRPLGGWMIVIYDATTPRKQGTEDKPKGSRARPGTRGP